MLAYLHIDRATRLKMLPRNRLSIQEYKKKKVL